MQRRPGGRTPRLSVSRAAFGCAAVALLCYFIALSVWSPGRLRRSREQLSSAGSRAVVEPPSLAPLPHSRKPPPVGHGDQTQDKPRQDGDVVQPPGGKLDADSADSDAETLHVSVHANERGRNKKTKERNLKHEWTPARQKHLYVQPDERPNPHPTPHHQHQHQHHQHRRQHEEPPKVEIPTTMDDSDFEHLEMQLHSRKKLQHHRSPRADERSEDNHRLEEEGGVVKKKAKTKKDHHIHAQAVPKGGGGGGDHVREDSEDPTHRQSKRRSEQQHQPQPEEEEETPPSPLHSSRRHREHHTKEPTWSSKERKSLGAAPSSHHPQYKNIFTGPLDKSTAKEMRRQDIIEAGAAKAAEDDDVLWDTNAILQQYKDIEPSTHSDDFFEESKDFWQNYPPAVVDLFKRYEGLNQRMKKKKEIRRYVSVRPVGQLCNRLMAISSGFVFALVTGRGLQFEDGDFYASISKDLFDSPGWNWADDHVGYSSGNSHTIENPFSGVWSETEPLLCGNYSKAYTTKHVHFAINQYLVPYITSNPHYRPAFRELFKLLEHDEHGGGGHVIGPGALFPAVVKFLFRPRQKLVERRDKYVEAHFRGHYVVGLQVRSGGDFTDHFMDKHDWSLYRDCAKASLSTVIATNNTGTAPGGVDDEGAHQEEEGKGEKKLKFFVATDTAKGREAATKYLGAENVMFGPGPFQLSNNPPGVQMALLDLMLLAAADDRVTTAWSSYGYFSAGLGGYAVNLVSDRVDESKWVASPGQEQRFMGVPHKSDRRAQCVRLPTVDPCFHKFASWGAEKAHCFKREMFQREMLNGRYC